MRSGRREWAFDGLRTIVATSPRPCRVCGEPIAAGEQMLRYTWSEELGSSHERCGFYSLTVDTWADREAVAAMRRLIEVGDGPVPPAVQDAALARGLVRRVHSAGTRGVQLHPTPVGAALYRLLTQTTASKRPVEHTIPPSAPTLDPSCSAGHSGAASGGRR